MRLLIILALTAASCSSTVHESCVTIAASNQAPVTCVDLVNGTQDDANTFAQQCYDASTAALTNTASSMLCSHDGSIGGCFDPTKNVTTWYWPGSMYSTAAALMIACTTYLTP